MQKPEDEKNLCHKIFILLSKRFGLDESPNIASLQFDNKKQEVNEKLDNFLDHPEALRIKAALGEPVKTRNLELIRKVLTGVLDEELRQSLLTSRTAEYYTENPPNVEQIPSKCHGYLTLWNVNNNRQRMQGDHSALSTKSNVPTSWTTPNAAQSNTYASNSGYAQGNGYNQSTHQNTQQNQVNPQHDQAQKRCFILKPPIDRSNYNCFACGEWGHVQKDCGSYRITLCRMGCGTPLDFCDPDEITRFSLLQLAWHLYIVCIAWKKGISNQNVHT